MMWWRRKPTKARRAWWARASRYLPGRRARLIMAGGAAAALLAVGGWTVARALGAMPVSPVAAATGLARDVVAREGARWGLAVREVLVDGRAQTTAAEIMTALGVRRGDPIFNFDAAAARIALHELPWVREAEVERRLPDTIYVSITERQPLALWQNQGRMAVIDRDGVVIRGAEPGRFPQLKIVVGEDAPQFAADLVTLLASEPRLAARVTHGVRVAGRRWNLRLEAMPGVIVEVQLPETNAAGAWVRLARAERDGAIIQRNVTLIDLRMPEQMILRVGPEAPSPVPAPTPPQRPVRPNARAT